jgi:hypothetical protein
MLTTCLLLLLLRLLPRLVLAQNKKELLTNWWNEGKLEASEDLGDLVSAAGEFALLPGSVMCVSGQQAALS